MHRKRHDVYRYVMYGLADVQSSVKPVGLTSKNHRYTYCCLIYCYVVRWVYTQELAGISFHHCETISGMEGIVECLWLARCIG